MKIYKGKTDWKDSFQELADCWAEKGYCETIRSIDNFSWAVAGKNKRAVLLYEYDRLGEIPSRETWDINNDLGLFANDQHKQGKPWIYWPRHIKNVEGVLSEGRIEKDIESIFVGAAENPIQYVNRTNYDWSLSVQHFEFKNALFKKDYHTYSNIDFLKLIARAKFGLSLEGYGPKCQRDIEYMANGVVPIFTWNKFNDYHHPLVEDTHYLFARNPREAKQKIESTSNEKWQEMSLNCRDWFQQNCSIEGSFKTTLEAMNE